MADDLSPIKNLYEIAFDTLNGHQPVPEIKVRFYPYVGINHTIRVRNGKVYVRLAELCRSAPLDIHESLAFILVGKLLKQKVLPQISAPYREYVKTDEMRLKAIENKRTRGRKIITTARGETYDLNQIFERLNILYFHNKLKKPTLSWSKRTTYRVLGHHDSTHETIIISKSLDDKSVPQYVVEYVVYHEMLHIFHPTEHRNGRRYNHTPQFQRDERKFAYFSEAEKWIEKNTQKLKRKAKKKQRSARK
jgi:predicted metal-dependent hydrolase